MLRFSGDVYTKDGNVKFMTVKALSEAEAKQKIKDKLAKHNKKVSKILLEYVELV